MANDFFIGGTSGDASVASNYSPPNVPSAADNLYFGALGVSSVSVGFGLAALAATALGTLSFASTYSGTVGLGPQVTFNITAGSESGSGPYNLVLTTSGTHGYSVGDTVVVAGVTPSGYNGTWVITNTTTNTFTVSSASNPGSYVSGGTAQRLSQMRVEASICRIGDASLSGTTGIGSNRLNLDFGSSAVACTIVSANTSGGLDSGLEPVRLLFNSSSASLSVESGLVGIATNTPADTSTIGTISVSGQSATLDVGPGVTFTTLQTSLGTTNVYAGGGTSKIYSGNLNFLGNTLLTAVYCYGGTVTLNARPSGAIVTDFYLYGGTLDLTGNPSPLTITNLHFRDGAIKQAYVGQLTIGTFTLDMTDKTNFSGSRS